MLRIQVHKAGSDNGPWKLWLQPVATNKRYKHQGSDLLVSFLKDWLYQKHLIISSAQLTQISTLV